MAKKYIYRNSQVFRAQFIDDKHAINVARNIVPQDERYFRGIEKFCKDYGIDMSDFKKIAKTISIEPELNPEDGVYYLNKNQYADMDSVVNSFLHSGNSLSKDISTAIRDKKFIEVDAIPEIETKEVKQNETEEYNNNKRFVDTVRRRNKRELKKKFIVGKKYFLKVRSITNNHTYKIYELKKFIYSINNRTVNIVVMKRLNEVEDEMNTTFTLNRTDCAKYHIKYEKGLQVFPMELNWCPVNENNVKFKEALKNE